MVNILIEKRYEDNLRFKKTLEGIKSVLYIKKTNYKIISDISKRDKNEKIIIVFGLSLNWLESTITKLNELGIHPLVAGARPRFHIVPFSYLTLDYSLAFYLMSKYVFSTYKINRALFLGFNPNSPHDYYKQEGFIRASNEMNVNYDVLINNGDSSSLINSLIEAEDKYDYISSVNDTLLVLYLSKSNKAKNKILSGFGGNKTLNHLSNNIISCDIDYVESGKAIIDLYFLLKKQPIIYPLSLKMPSKIKINNEEIIPSEMVYPKANDIDFYHDKTIEEIDNIEKMFLLMDDIDLKIIHLLKENEKYEVIADELFLSLSTVKYRLNKYLKETHTKDKKELFALLDKYKIKV